MIATNGTSQRDTHNINIKVKSNHRPCMKKGVITGLEQMDIKEKKYMECKEESSESAKRDE